ncbi:MAG: pantetheine-phosphate adenylyltransferase [Dermabacter sp.]|nr:pantetheine-phosphate adenylyltransferase [Dermabacter sp.]
MPIALVPGSFDPFTLGHLDLVRRAAQVSDRVIVAVSHNPGKVTTLGIDVRVGIIRDTIQAEGLSERVSVEQLPAGLLVDGARALGATHLVKGLRGPTDLAYEEPMARMNMELAGLDTLFLLTDPRLAHVSSSLVREIFSLGADVGPFLPPAALAALTRHGAH